MDQETARDLAFRTGESVVLAGSISTGRGYALHLRLEAVSADPRHESASEERDFDAVDKRDLFRAIADAAEWVRKRSGEGTRELNEQNSRPEDLSTGSWQALKLLEEARSRRADNDPKGALIFAKEALGLDSGFAAAESFLADVHTDLGQYKEAFARYKHAFELVKARNVTGRERYEIEASYDVDAGDDEASATTYEAWIAHFPQDYLPHFYIGYRLFHRGEYATAVAELERARQLGPQQSFILPHLAAAYLANGQNQSAQRCAALLKDLGENDWALEVEGVILLAQHRFDEAARKVAPLSNHKDGLFTSLGPRYVASALADAGHLQEAEQTLLKQDLNRDLRSPARVADRQLTIAYLRWARGDLQGTRAALAEVVTDLDNPDSLSLAGALFARIGDLGSARRTLTLINRWPRVPSVTRASERERREIAVASHLRISDVIVAGFLRTPHSPFDLEFLLHIAQSMGNTSLTDRIRNEITARHDILLTWDGRTSPPGLYWLAMCGNGCKPK